jgi:hypothetical protein
MARYLCPAGVFHDWSDEAIEISEIPALKLCPLHVGDEPTSLTELRQRISDNLNPVNVRRFYESHKKEEKQNS